MESVSSFDLLMQAWNVVDNLAWMSFVLFIMCLVVDAVLWFRFHNREHNRVLYPEDRKYMEEELRYVPDELKRDISLRTWKDNRALFYIYNELTITYPHVKNMSLVEFMESIPKDVRDGLRSINDSVSPGWPGMDADRIILLSTGEDEKVRSIHKEIDRKLNEEKR